jgi:hypothetical protein
MKSGVPSNVFGHRTAGTPIDRRSRGRPKTRWKDDVEAGSTCNEDYELENKDRG